MKLKRRSLAPPFLLLYKGAASAAVPVESTGLCLTNNLASGLAVPGMTCHCPRIGARSHSCSDLWGDLCRWSEIRL